MSNDLMKRPMELSRALSSEHELTLADVMAELAMVRQDIAALRSDLAVTFSADEFDVKRREMSNELAEKVQKRLAAEEWARKLTTGEL